MAKKEPYDMTNSYARMERDKRKAIGNPNKNVHHKKNGSNYQKDTGSMVRSTSARQEPEKMSTTMKVLIGVVFVVLVAACTRARTVCPCTRWAWRSWWSRGTGCFFCSALTIMSCRCSIFGWMTASTCTWSATRERECIPCAFPRLAVWTSSLSSR